MTALRPALALAAALLALAVSGCATSAPVASSTPTPAATTPGATAAPEEPEPAALLLTGGGFTVVDDEGAVLFEHAWNGSIADATEELTALFGEPETTVTPQGDIRGESLELVWEDIQFQALAAYDQPLDGAEVVSSIQVQETEIDGILVSTASGASVGMTADEILALGARATPEIPYALDPENPDLIDSTDEVTNVVSAEVGPDGTVLQLVAPKNTFGNM